MNCNLCDCVVPSMPLLLRHIGRVHASSDNFSITCGVDGCMRTYKNYRRFKEHLKSVHKDYFPQQPLSGSDSSLPRVEDATADMECDNPGFDMSEYDQVDGLGENSDLNRMKNMAMWILKLKEKRKLTQVAVDGVLDDVTELCATIILQLQDSVKSKLSACGVNFNEIPGLPDLFTEKSVFCQPFRGLETHHQQLSFYRTHLSFVEPTTVSLGTRYVTKHKGQSQRLVEKTDTFVYIPILKTLENLLKDSKILDEIQEGHFQSGEMMDFCDSVQFKEHLLFSLDPHALQIVLYYDDVEFCNPLGAYRKKHKLGCFYFQLGNINPKYRSRLDSIQLVSLVKYTYIEQYGMDEILKPVVADIKKLEKGVYLDTCVGPLEFSGALTVICADNLGSHSLGGFKQGGRALRCCRHCLVTSDALQEMFVEDPTMLRSTTTHNHHCDLLEGPLAEFYSTTYGVTRNSILNSLDHYHVCDMGLPPDLMHDVLEGALPFTMKLLLRQFIDEVKLFTLNDFNEIVRNFEYGYQDSSDKPSEIQPKTLNSAEKTKMGQSASQMWCLGRLLPVMIGEFVPEGDPFWRNYLQLLHIIEQVFSPVISSGTAPYVQVLLEEYLETFHELYPTHTIIPKMHYLLHLPRYLESIGPVVRYWTMRYEAKHQYFKHLTSTMGNFINLPYSLAMRHQCLQAYLLASGTAIRDEKEIGKGSVIRFAETDFEHELEIMFGERINGQIFRSNTAKLHGYTLKPGATMLLGSDEWHIPSFGLIQEIFVESGEVYVGLEALTTSYFSEHTNSWVVKSTSGLSVLKYEGETLTWPRAVTDKPKHYHINLKYSFL